MFEFQTIIVTYYAVLHRLTVSPSNQNVRKSTEQV